MTDMLWMLFTDPFSTIKIFLLKQEEEWIFITAEASPGGMDKAGPWSSCYEKACCGFMHTRNFRNAMIIRGGQEGGRSFLLRCLWLTRNLCWKESS